MCTVYVHPGSNTGQFPWRRLLAGFCSLPADNKKTISPTNKQTHGGALNSLACWEDVISARPLDEASFTPSLCPRLLLVICCALHTTAIRQTADAECLKREICCLGRASGRLRSEWTAARTANKYWDSSSRCAHTHTPEAWRVTERANTFPAGEMVQLRCFAVVLSQYCFGRLGYDTRNSIWYHFQCSQPLSFHWLHVASTQHWFCLRVVSRCLILPYWKTLGENMAQLLFALTNLPSASLSPSWCVALIPQNPASWRDIDGSPATLSLGTPGSSSVRHVSHSGDDGSKLGKTVSPSAFFPQTSYSLVFAVRSSAVTWTLLLSSRSVKESSRKWARWASATVSEQGRPVTQQLGSLLIDFWIDGLRLKGSYGSFCQNQVQLLSFGWTRTVLLGLLYKSHPTTRFQK